MNEKIERRHILDIRADLEIMADVEADTVINDALRTFTMFSDCHGQEIGDYFLSILVQKLVTMKRVQIVSRPQVIYVNEGESN